MNGMEFVYLRTCNVECRGFNERLGPAAQNR
jgi:hypothetical protein